MLPRVSAALQQFISPITTTSQKPQEISDSDQGPTSGGGFERFRPPKKEEKKAPSLEVVAQPKPASQNGAEPPPAQTPTQTFLQLFQAIDARFAVFKKLLGMRTYQQTLRNQKKHSRFRKGAMLDQKAG